MHNNLAHEITLWEDVATKLQRTVASYQGNPLSRLDNASYAEAIALACCCLVDLRNQRGLIGDNRDIVAWAHYVHSLDVYEVATCLSDAITALRNIYEPTSMTQFKRCVGHPTTIGRMIAPARTAFDSFLSEPSARTFAICNQFLSFLTHLSLRDINLSLEEEYEGLEASLAAYEPPEAMLSAMNKIMRGWMEGFALRSETFSPQHGPGSVAGLTRSAHVAEKYQAFGSDARLSYVFRKHLDLDVSTFTPYPVQILDRCSEVVFVPKSMKTRRTISKEPASLQFFQQGIRKELYSFIESHPFLSRHIDLDDQPRNGRLALAGSRTGGFATIDLSSASDRVTLHIVKRLFNGTSILPFLVGTRSQSAVLPSGKKIELRKFAPMGSALCFPIQTLVFSCAVEYAVRRAQTTYLGYFPTWRVYGDDIIVQDAVYDDVLLVLETLGFVANRSKSFSTPTRFRESCGVEGYDGVDVTPLKISRRFKAPGKRFTSRHASLFEGLIEFANRAYSYKFSLLRARTIRILLDRSTFPPLFSAEGQGALLSTWPDNYRAKRRWNIDFQIQEIEVARSASLLSEQKYTDTLEPGRLFETLRQTRNRHGDMFLPEHRVEVPRGTESSKLVHTFVMPPFWGVRTV